jgi:hypothetical protein
VLRAIEENRRGRVAAPQILEFRIAQSTEQRKIYGAPENLETLREERFDSWHPRLTYF